MAKKTDLQVILEMNENDIKNNTANLGICYHCIGANTVKQGASIQMGAPASVVMAIGTGDTIPVLLLINKDEFFRIKNAD